MDYRMNAEPGEYKITGSDSSGTIMRTAESWQFFAFVFAALLTFVLSLIDSVVAAGYTTAIRGFFLKVLSAMAVGYVVLFNKRGRNTLVRWLTTWKEERY